MPRRSGSMPMCADQPGLEEAPYRGIVIGIPTRNRPDLAMRAIRSVLGQRPEAPLEVLVSDNSTEPDSASLLSEFCRSAQDERLRYLTPQAPLSMTRHWEWLIQEALRLSDKNHFAFLADRAVIRPSSIACLESVARRRPEQVISYGFDAVLDNQTPVRVAKGGGSGLTLEVGSSRLLELSAHCSYSALLPRMLNSLAPRAVLDELRRRFGSVFDSISPDYNFSFRCLACVQTILCLDAPLVIGYGLNRSNGMAFTTGVRNSAFEDFVRNLNVEGLTLHGATPLPEIWVSGNGIVHEYCTVRNECGGPPFPGLDPDDYLEFLAQESIKVNDPQQRGELLDILVKSGWRSRPRGARTPSGAGASLLRTAVSGWNRLLGSLQRHIEGAAEFESTELALAYLLEQPSSCRFRGSRLRRLRRELQPLAEWPPAQVPPAPMPPWTSPDYS